MRARYYSPAMKRFVNADVVRGKLSNAITMNRYAYANGNPVSYVDPFGNFSIWTTILIGLVLSASTALSGCGDGQRSEDNVEINPDDYERILEEHPKYLMGRYESAEEVVLGEYESILLQEVKSSKETGYVVYKLYGGYYLSRPQSGFSATETSVKISLDSIPYDAEAVATVHTHPWHNETLIYRPEEHHDIQKEGISSYVVDVNGWVYVLHPEADNHMEYEIVKVGKDWPYVEEDFLYDFSAQSNGSLSYGSIEYSNKVRAK